MNIRSFLVCTTLFFFSNLYALEKNIHSMLEDIILSNLSYPIRNIEIHFDDSGDVKNLLELSDALEILLLDLHDLKRIANFKALYCDGSYKNFSVEFDGIIKVLISNKYIKANQPISQGDFDVMFAKLSKTAGKDFISSVNNENILSMRANKHIHKNKIIESSDLSLPYLVNPNDLIDIIYQANGIYLKTKAVALGAGRVGDVIKVQNYSSSNMFFATIINHKMAQVE